MESLRKASPEGQGSDIHTVRRADLPDSGLAGFYYYQRAGVLRQKEIIRTRFNVFRYFDIITGNMSLLAEKRPITLNRP